MIEFHLKKEDLITLDIILGFRKVNGEDLELMVSFMREHIDNSVVVCNRCDTQIRFAHKRVVKWSDLNEIKINRLRYGK